jgi:hypothetical protein
LDDASDRVQRSRPEDRASGIEDFNRYERYVQLTGAILIYIRGRIRHPDFAALANEELQDD